MADEANKPELEEPKADDGSGDNDSSSSSDESDSYELYYDDDFDAGGVASWFKKKDSKSQTRRKKKYYNSPLTNYNRIMAVIHSPEHQQKLDEEDLDYFYEHLHDPFDFPPDPEMWREEDLRELWADGPLWLHNKPGWDPVFADDEDWEGVEKAKREGEDTPIAPFYLPFRKFNPVIPDNHFDIYDPKSVIEELDRVEMFLSWDSSIFPDGSTYEGTVWDDLAHGKGVFEDNTELVRYEGEWFQNQMEGHGVVEVDIPEVQPLPGSELEKKMRAKGRIIARDFMSPADSEWLKMDMEDAVDVAGHIVEIPFYERDEWVKIFGQKPEKGRYRYAGQWKHGRMHGCGVYEVNATIKYGKFYFGGLLEDSTGCDLDVSLLHAGIAEVAAAKARMFVNKPEGMVREYRGPHSDPQHPYFYEEEDVWMAPGFVNQFYEVPELWQNYVEDVDQEREMWLNSFYKAPLRIPMPAELEYWWSKGNDESEFVLINKEPEPDPENPSNLIYTEDPLIVHTPTGRLINYVDDPKYGIRLFFQPPPPDLDESDTHPCEQELDPEKVEFLPLGFDKFFGWEDETEQPGLLKRIEGGFKSWCERLEKWGEEKRKQKETNLQLIEKELDFVEAEICLEEVVDDMEYELERKQREEEKKAESDDNNKNKGDKKKDLLSPNSADSGDKGKIRVSADDAQDDEDEDDDEDDGGAPASFGTVKKSAFSSLSLSAVSPGLMPTVVPCRIQESFLAWTKKRLLHSTPINNCTESEGSYNSKGLNSIKFQIPLNNFQTNLRVGRRPSPPQIYKRKNTYSHLDSLARNLSACQAREKANLNLPELSILSLHVHVTDA